MSIENIIVVVFFSISELVCMWLIVRMKRDYYIAEAQCIGIKKYIDASLDGSTSYRAKYRYICREGITMEEECLSLLKPSCEGKCRILIKKTDSKKIKPIHHLSLLFGVLAFSVIVEVGVLLF